MGYQVRQLSFGEILDQAFQVLKDNFVLLAGIMALFYVPYALIMSLVTRAVQPTDVPQLPNMATIGVGLLGMLAMLAILPLAQLAATRAVSDAYLSTPSSLADAYKAGLKLYLPYAGTCLLVGLALIGLSFLLVVPAIYFAICWSLVGPLAVVEGVFGGAAMKRSRALVSGMWWRTLGVLFVAGMIAGIVSAAVNMVLSSIPVIGAVCSGAVQAVAAAYTSVAVVVLYVDLRCRHEDFDLQLLAGQVAGTASAQPVIPDPVRI